MPALLSVQSEAYVTAITIALLLLALIKNWGPPDVLFLGSLLLFVLLGIITPQEAFAGLSNPGMLTVAFLFVVSAGLKETGVLDDLGRRLLHRSTNSRQVLLRLGVVVIGLSAFLNNTPIVAMFIPIVLDWSRRNQVSPSQLLIPLSFLAILGGTCTLIGTSTNLVVNGLMIQNGLTGLPLFELSWIGIPYAIVGALYLWLLAPVLLPERQELLEQLGQARREYLVEMKLLPGCRLNGQSVIEAGLRQLPGLFLIEINRGGNSISPVGPDELLCADDRLIFTGIVSSIIELKKIPGLVPVADPEFESKPNQQRQRKLCEAVVSENSPLVGKTFREADFRANYGAAVVAVHRGGQRVDSKIGDIRIKPGDTLLLQAQMHFARAHRNDPAFYLISNVEEWTAVRHDRVWIARLLFLGLIALMTLSSVPTEIAACLCAILMIASGCLSASDARHSIEWQVVLTIAAAFGVGTAMQNSGLAAGIASTLVESTLEWGPLVGLIAIYLVGSCLTEVITNNAAAVLMFPICLEAARAYQIEPRPFLIALMLSASASFMTPIGYQTNMMVYGPGGYRFTDFLRIGAPLNILLGILAIILIPIIWPLTAVTN